MLWIYSPHWAPAKFEGEWVEFPESTSRLLRRIRHGASTPTRRTIAASRIGDDLESRWAGMKDKWPGAYKAAKAYHDQRRRDERS